jgi:fatty-acyl-CoA synthase
MLIGLLEAHERCPHDMSSLRTVLSGGAMVPPELVRRVQDGFGCRFAIIYGQTETSPGLTQTRLTDSLADQTESVGQPFAQTDVSIRDPDTNAVVPVGVVGEICGRGYCTMIGYNDNSDATAKTIDGNGWLHTGDLGTIDTRGYVRVTGRVKDMIIRGGENIYPRELEELLFRHPKVGEVAVIGVPHEKWEEVAAFVRPVAGAVIDKDEMTAYMRASLAPHKTPKHWFVVDSFPLTGSGKIQKYKLREAWAKGELAAI